MEKRKERAAFLLRVSDRKQLEKYEDDIPTQRATNAEYIRKKGWVFVKEYEEPAVSAYKVSKDDRTVLKEALKDAKLGKYDILVVFHYTRLSRISEEYIVILNEFYKYGVRVFSATEDKELEVGDHNLKLLRFIEGWQSQVII